MHMPDQQRTRIPVGANALGELLKRENNRYGTGPADTGFLRFPTPNEATSQADKDFRLLSHPREDHTSEGMVSSHLNEVTS